MFDDYDRYDGLGLGELIAGGELTSGEVLAEMRARVAIHNPGLNAIVELYEDELEAAPSGNGPFAGLPMFVKDLNLYVEGHVTAEWLSCDEDGRGRPRQRPRPPLPARQEWSSPGGRTLQNSVSHRRRSPRSMVRPTTPGGRDIRRVARAAAPRPPSLAGIVPFATPATAAARSGFPRRPAVSSA